MPLLLLNLEYVFFVIGLYTVEWTAKP